MRCDDLPELLESYLADELDGPRRNTLRAHLRSCSDCRGVAIRRDPSLLFIVTAPVEAPAARVEQATEAVLGQIRQQRLERRLGHRRQPWLAAAAAVVLSLLAVAGWRLLAPAESGPAPIHGDVQVVDLPSPPPRVEVDMAGEGVRVYQYADQQDADTAVTFIINPELEL